MQKCFNYFPKNQVNFNAKKMDHKRRKYAVERDGILIYKLFEKKKAD
jgi:hypothetical protein